MAEEKNDIEAKLNRLGEAFRRGIERLEPVTESQLGPVREAIRKKWETDHAGKKETAAEEKPAESPTADQDEATRNAEELRKSKRHGHSH